MSTIIQVSAVVLCLTGVIFSLVYVWMNAFSKYIDIEDRDAGMLEITKKSMVFSFIFTLLACLFVNVEDVGNAICRASKTYFFYTVCWLVVILTCGISMFVVLVSKRKYRRWVFKSIKRIFSNALVGAIVGMLLSWLLS